LFSVLKELDPKYKVILFDEPANYILEKNYPNAKVKLDRDIYIEKSHLIAKNINYGIMNGQIKISGLYNFKIDNNDDEALKAKKKNLLEMGIYLIKLIGSENYESKKIGFKKI